MAEIHSTNPARINPDTAINMSDTVQFPPMKSLMPRSRAACMTGKFTGSRTMTAFSSILNVDAASIQ